MGEPIARWASAGGRYALTVRGTPDGDCRVVTTTSGRVQHISAGHTRLSAIAYAQRAIALAELVDGIRYRSHVVATEPE